MTDESIGRLAKDDADEPARGNDRQAAGAPGAPVQPASVPASPPPNSPVVPPVHREPAAPAAATPRAETRESRLARILDRLMHDSMDVEASALVTLDGFIMASALPDAMSEDRVGAMSAAILALGERASAELGRGQLTQVFIEGEDGYVLLVAAGDRAVLTVIARKAAKLGLVLYDMRAAAGRIAEILG